MELKERISQWIDAHEQDLLDDTSRLVAVRSVKGEAAPGAPFGLAPKKALDEALALCQGYGFDTRVYDDCVGTADLAPGLPKGLDILGHLDVVAAGEGWHGDPFNATVSTDYLYGRGTDDDKGPVSAALLAMRCVRELGLPLTSNCRLIMGTDEESGSDDLPHYYGTEPPAPCTFTPDAGFPVYNVEKGRYAPTFAKALSPEDALPRVIRIDAGVRANVIPGDARAVVAGLDVLTALVSGMDMAKDMDVNLSVTPRDDGNMELVVFGKQAHAASPEDGNNALTALLHILDAWQFADVPSTRAVKKLARLFPHGDWRGKALGIAQTDAVSGELTVSLNILHMDGNGISGQFDARVPVCANEDNCSSVASARLLAAGYTVEGSMQPAHHTPGDSPFVQTLLHCYETYTGKKGECLSTGGGTYVHGIPGGVAFGASMPGFESNLHGVDERMNIKDMLTAAKIFALAIAELCGGQG